MNIPVVATDRLVLRGWRDADRAPFAALNGDPEVARFLGGGPRDRAASDALIDKFVEHWRANPFGLWAIERTENGALLGFAGLSRPGFEAHFTPAVEVGWRLARAAWGNGYATEAARAALRFGFEIVDLDEIVSFTVPANERSRRVMERLGMTHDEGDEFDHPRLPEGHALRRHVLYRLRRADWQRRQPA